MTDYPTAPAAKVLAHSISPDGDEVITYEIWLHRFILAELNTHSVLKRNASSSRAIPVRRQLEALEASPAMPVVWPQEKSGMQGGAPLEPAAQVSAEGEWMKALTDALAHARKLAGLGLHKSLTNRLLEPFMWQKVVITGTAWENFYRQRLHPDAQPEFYALAAAMHAAREQSVGRRIPKHGFHLPYVTERDYDVVDESDDRTILEAVEEVGLLRTLARISSARCARTSFLTNPVVGADGRVLEEARVDHVKDLGLYSKLVADEPRHWSPLEHPCTPWAENKQLGTMRFNIGRDVFKVPTDHLPRTGPLYGFRTLRTEVEAMLGDVTFR